jgi:hypothetical protein
MSTPLIRPSHTSRRSTGGSRHAARSGEQGWVVVASLILAGIAASVSVTWARHAVLAKSTLEMSHGASESEEAAQSGLNHAREQMRQGHPPGNTSTGTEDVVLTEDGHVVTIEREVHVHDNRELRTHATKLNGAFTEQAAVRARARVVPESDADGDPTRLECDSDAVTTMMAGLVTVLNGSNSYENVEMAGLFILEPGADLTLENVVLRGTIITRAGKCNSAPKQVGANRPTINLIGDIRLIAGTVLPDVAFVGPDAVMTADANARVEIQGQVIADELDMPCRGSVHGMVTTEKQGSIGSNVKRPGRGRGAQGWSSELVAGAERVTEISFPSEPYTVAEMDAMESCNVFN